MSGRGNPATAANGTRVTDDVADDVAIDDDDEEEDEDDGNGEAG